jgi:hypothetical protein
MPAKALAISVAAALLGPAIGIGVFLAGNAEPLRDKAGSPQARVADPVTESNQADVIRTFAPPGLWSTPATTQHSPKLEPWRTAVSCSDGQPLGENARCPVADGPQATDNHSTATAGDFGPSEIARPDAPSPLPGRMSLFKTP